MESIHRSAACLMTDAPSELAARFPDAALHAAGRRLDEVRPLSAEDAVAPDGRRIHVSLGLSGAEAVLARALSKALASSA